MSVISCPSFPDLFAEYAKFLEGGVGLFEMAVQGGARHGDPVDLFKESVDRVWTAEGLLLFQLQQKSTVNICARFLIFGLLISETENQQHM